MVGGYWEGGVYLMTAHSDSVIILIAAGCLSVCLPFALECITLIKYLNVHIFLFIRCQIVLFFICMWSNLSKWVANLKWGFSPFFRVKAAVTEF